MIESFVAHDRAGHAKAMCTRQTMLGARDKLGQACMTGVQHARQRRSIAHDRPARASGMHT